MKKLENTIYWTIIASEASHIFCCVLPTVFSVLSLLAGIGIVTAMPMWLEVIHEHLHDWEVPMICISGALLALGWGLYLYSQRIDCHDSGCGHGPCEPKKKASSIVLKIATFLFLANVLVFLIFHRGMGVFVPDQSEIHHAHHETHAH